MATRTPRLSKARKAELERRLKEIHQQEKVIKDRIYKLEASITAAPVRSAARRLSQWNTVPADEPVRRNSSLRPTRWQKQRINRARSRQAITAAFLMGLLVLFACWFYHQLCSNGVL